MSTLESISVVTAIAMIGLVVYALRLSMLHDIKRWENDYQVYLLIRGVDSLVAKQMAQKRDLSSKWFANPLTCAEIDLIEIERKAKYG